MTYSTAPLTAYERMYVSFSGLWGNLAVEGTIREVVAAWRESGMDITNLAHALVVGKSTLANEGREAEAEVVDGYLDMLSNLFAEELEAV